MSERDAKMVVLGYLVGGALVAIIASGDGFRPAALPLAAIIGAVLVGWGIYELGTRQGAKR